MGRKVRVIRITWTGLPVTGTVAGNNYADDDDTTIYMGGSETATITLDTRNVSTNSPTFDIHTYGTNDIGAWPAVTSQFQTNIITAQAKNTVATVAFNRGPRALKFLMDINTATLEPAEYVILTVYLTEAN